MSLTPGDVASITYGPLTVDGEATDATVTLTVTAPDGTISSPTPSHTGTGTYQADVFVSQAGTWTYRWVAAGAATDAEEGTFTVGGPVSIDAVKAHLQMTGTSNDNELQRFLDVAVAAISTRVGPLVPVEVTEILDGGRDCLLLRHPRAVSLTSITYADGTTTTLSDFDLDPATGIVYWNSGTVGRFLSGRRNVRVTYVAGWGTVPADLTHAVKELVRHLWETQRGASSGVRPGFADSGDPAPVAGAYSSWPIRVQELVAPYIVPKVA